MGIRHTQHVGRKRVAGRYAGARRRRLRGEGTPPRRTGSPDRRREDGSTPPGTRARPGVFRQRRATAVVALLLIPLAVVSGALALSLRTEETAPIAAGRAEPDVVLAEVAGLGISTPIRPSGLTGLGYHPDGESLLEMEARGKRASSWLSALPGGSTPEDIRYYAMDPAGRAGPETGALDVGARTGSVVYSPVDGIITAIRPDPLVEGANLVEIQPSKNPDLRVYVSLVDDISPGKSVETPVRAGKTKLGTVADCAAILDTQLSSYIGGAGNHVTVSVVRLD